MLKCNLGPSHFRKEGLITHILEVAASPSGALDYKFAGPFRLFAAIGVQRVFLLKEASCMFTLKGPNE